MDHDKTREAALAPEALADPPTALSGAAYAPAGSSAASSAPSQREPFAEFMTTDLPRWALVRHRMDPEEVTDVAAAVAAALDQQRAAVKPGSRVCLAVGSRGIDRIDEVVRAAVAWFRAAGHSVFAIPAMGSHGGATPEGQLEVLASYGITPRIDRLRDPLQHGDGRAGFGSPRRAGLRRSERLSKAPTSSSRSTASSRTPTSPARVESGLMKMIAIGLGKQRGADTFHRQGFAVFHELIPASRRIHLSKVNIPFGLALVENGYARLWRIEAVPRDRVWDRERELLAAARSADGAPAARQPSTSWSSTTSARTSAGSAWTRTSSAATTRGPPAIPPRIQRIVVRDLTAETEGNAVGIGMADVVLRPRGRARWTRTRPT